jgi:adenylate cyclase
VNRRLAAILAADVVGYSRLVELDEAGTLAALRERRKGVLDPTVARHHGRIVKVMGDGVLVEFGSAVNAVACAVELQMQFAAANESLAEDRRIVLRVGVNLGDVVVEGGDLYGDGVIIAVRLQAMAEPGGMCVSGSVHEQVAGKLDAVFDDQGLCQVKNSSKPVRVYRLASSGDAAPPLPKTTSGRPSIAVMPFRNLSSDPEQDYFADGIAEDITTALGHFRHITVISRNSAFSFKGIPTGTFEVGRELGVRYLLQGSVRKSGHRLRLTAQLIEAESGVQLWADHLDGELAEIFGFQDEVTSQVIGAIAPRVINAELERLRRKRPESLDAYEIYLRAQASLRDMTRQENDLALSLVEHGLELEPGYAALAGLGAWAFAMRAAQDWSMASEEDKRKGLALAEKALALGQDDAEALSLAGYTIGFLGSRLNEGIKAIERAISLNPNSALALTNSGWLKTYLGRPESAIADFERARRLSPRDPGLYRLNSGLCCALIQKGDLTAAIEAAQEAVADNPNYVPAQRALASALALAGRVEEARRVVANLRRLGITISSNSVRSLARYASGMDRVLEGLRIAGLPE